METRFNTVGDAGALEELFTRSHEAPVLVFKHSTTCPISARAYQEMKRAESDVSLIVVQKARDLSRAFEERTGVRHESPQALVLRRGEAVWSASHWDITADAVNRAVRENE